MVVYIGKTYFERDPDRARLRHRFPPDQHFPLEGITRLTIFSVPLTDEDRALCARLGIKIK